MEASASPEHLGDWKWCYFWAASSQARPEWVIAGVRTADLRLELLNDLAESWQKYFTPWLEPLPCVIKWSGWIKVFTGAFRRDFSQAEFAAGANFWKWSCSKRMWLEIVWFEGWKGMIFKVHPQCKPVWDSKCSHPGAAATVAAVLGTIRSVLFRKRGLFSV